MNTMDVRLGLPPLERLIGLRIWDSYFTPSYSHPGKDGFSGLIADIERSLPAIRKGAFEKLCYFPHVGIGTTSDRELEALLRSEPSLILQPLQRWSNLLMGMIQLNAADVSASMDAIERWIVDGPMVGAYFRGGGPGSVVCTDPRSRKLAERLVEIDAVIMQHTWYKTGGKDSDGESTPAEVAEVAREYPEHTFICAHAGGEWEKGIRAIRDVENVAIETSGFDATAGFIEMAVREMGADRIIFGSHLPSRSLGTELSKVLSAGLGDVELKKVLGENFRKLIRRSGEK